MPADRRIPGHVRGRERHDDEDPDRNRQAEKPAGTEEAKPVVASSGLPTRLGNVWPPDESRAKPRAT